MKGLLVSLFLAILMIITTIMGYSQGWNAECGDMVNSCNGTLGAMIGIVIVGAVWAFIILPLGIFLYLRFVNVVSGEEVKE